MVVGAAPRREKTMKGNEEVILILQDVLCAELTAINQYFIHARMCENWRYKRLAAHLMEESIGEMKHAQLVIDRILYFDGFPNMQKYMKINVGKTVTEQHQFDVQLEYDAVARLNAGVELCRAKGDNGTRALLEDILKSEEGHIDWLEAQLHQIQEIGTQNYLAQQLEA
jgi:bacterioferritin